MKLRILVILLALLVNNSFAQTSSTNICSSSSITSWNSKPTDIQTVSEAKNIITTIISAIGLKQNFEVMAADVPNAAAVIYQNKRYILYNPDFINGLNDKAGNKWASISILAHEVGHHLNGHTLDNMGSRPDLELEADEFSGFVLRKLGATLTQAQEAMKLAADFRSSETHPGQAQRLTAISLGWNNAGNQSIGKDIAKNSPVSSTPRQSPVFQQQQAEPQQTVYNRAGNTRTQQTIYNDHTRTQQSEAAIMVNDRTTANTDEGVLASRYILADINFAVDQQSAFFVTTRYNVVKVADNQLYLVGKLITTDSEDFPYMITDDKGTKLFVDTRGNIVTSDDRKVGQMKAH